MMKYRFTVIHDITDPGQTDCDKVQTDCDKRQTVAVIKDGL